MAHADQGDLHTDAVIDHQIRRMLIDPKSKALVDNFAEQWLQLRILNEVTPDPNVFSDFFSPTISLCVSPSLQV